MENSTHQTKKMYYFNSTASSLFVLKDVTEQNETSMKSFIKNEYKDSTRNYYENSQYITELYDSFDVNKFWKTSIRRHSRFKVLNEIICKYC